MGSNRYSLQNLIVSGPDIFQRWKSNKQDKKEEEEEAGFEGGRLGHQKFPNPYLREQKKSEGNQTLYMNRTQKMAMRASSSSEKQRRSMVMIESCVMIQVSGFFS